MERGRECEGRGRGRDFSPQEKIVTFFCFSDVTFGCLAGDVRLVQGLAESEGRVEVCLHGRWGTVCDDQWGRLDAQVLCFQLGYMESEENGEHLTTKLHTHRSNFLSSPVSPPARPVGVAYAVGGAVFGGGSGLIILDNVECSGEEMSLLECAAHPYGVHNCDTSEDAGVFCPSKSPPTVSQTLCCLNSSEGRAGRTVITSFFAVFAVPNQPCTNGELRLADGERAGLGRVEVCLGGVWSTVCGLADWDDLDAQVVCRQLGFPNPEGKPARNSHRPM